MNEFWEHFVYLLGIKHKPTSPYHPQSDPTERYNRTILQSLRTLLIRKKHSEWIEEIPKIQFAINSTINESTGQTPFKIVYGIKPKLSV